MRTPSRAHEILLEEGKGRGGGYRATNRFVRKTVGYSTVLAAREKKGGSSVFVAIVW